MKKIWFISWVVTSTLILGVVMSRHMVAFQKPMGLEQVAKFFTRAESNDKKFHALHIVDPRCGCSNRVLEYLQDAALDQNFSHTILTVNSLKLELESKLLKRQEIKIETITPELAKAQFKIETVPWFVVLDSDLNILYSGGYAKDKIRAVADLQIDQIQSNLKAGRSIASLPSFGCVTSQDLRRLLLQL